MVADDTQYATKGHLSVIRWIDPSIDIDSYIIQRVEDAGGIAIPGNVMTGAAETQGNVDVCAESDTSFLGIMLNETIIPADYDIDEAADAADSIDILRPTGGRTIVAVILASHTGVYAFEEGDPLRVGDTAGQVESWIYNDTNMSTDTFALVVGKSAGVYTTASTSDHVIHIWY